MFEAKLHNWKYWENMPEYIHSIKKEYKSVILTFDNPEDIKHFNEKTELNIGENSRSVWFPKKIFSNCISTTRYISSYEDYNIPKYPIYIVSKNRWEKRLTSDSLAMMKVPHYIVVEESQYEQYKNHVNPEYCTVIVLDPNYLDNYDTCDDLGNSKSKGPGAARNFAWDHSISLGFKRHWVMDDNIAYFYRMNLSKRYIVNSGAIIRAMEDHTDRYSNIHMSGPNYRFFCVPDALLPPVMLNTRIYSCNLILNESPYKWRGRYNEDTDISLRMLKAGFCTFQYNAFLQGKVATQTMKGGNTEEFYSKEGTLPKSKMLKNLHPDITEVVWKYGRWHHYVDYKVFRNNIPNLIDKSLLDTDIINNYGMELKNELLSQS